MDMINKGRKIIIVLIVIVLLMDIISIASVSLIYAANSRMDIASYKILQGTIRLILTVLLLFFLYKGHRWAKWLFVVLFFITGIISLLSFVSSLNMIFLVMGLTYTAFGVIIVASASVNSFFQYQRGELKSNCDKKIE